MRIQRHLLLWLTLALVATLPGAPTPVLADVPVAEVHIIGDQGQALPARVSIIAPGDPYPDITVLFTDAQGVCKLPETEADPVSVQVNHGPEWSIESREANVDPAAGQVLTVQLKRLYSLASKDYYQGDCHMHSVRSTSEPGARIGAASFWM